MNTLIVVLKKIDEGFTLASELIGKLTPESVLEYMPADKFAHLVIGFLFGLVATYLLPNATIALLALIVLAVGKELYDALYAHYGIASHDVDPLDALVTILSGMLGIGLVILIKLIL